MLGTSQTRVPLQISGGDVAQNHDTAGLDGIEWHQLTLGEYSSERFSQQNILMGSSDPSPLAKRSVCAGSLASAWLLLVVNHIRKCTATEVHQQMQNQTFPLTVEELESSVAVMYARGITGKSGLALQEIWTGVCH